MHRHLSPNGQFGWDINNTIGATLQVQPPPHAHTREEEEELVALVVVVVVVACGLKRSKEVDT